MPHIFDINKHLGDYFMEKFENVFERMDYILEKEGMTITNLSKKSGINDQTLRGIYSRRSKPGYDVIVKIVNCIEWVDANWLIMGESTESFGNLNDRLLGIIESQQRTIEALTLKIEPVK